MLSEEDKARIEAEEQYRASLRGNEKPVQVTSFTDKANKVGFVLWLILIVPLMGLLLVMCARG